MCKMEHFDPVVNMACVAFPSYRKIKNLDRIYHAHPFLRVL
jgi:hypothetical protein